jgi:starvation-inducible outer membrane lipoprotein
MIALRLSLLLLLLLGGLSGCSPRMVTAGQAGWAKDGPAGPEVFARPALHVGDRRILGGVILGVRQDPGRATIRLLAYPLDEKDYPETEKPPLGSAVLLWSGPPLSTLFVTGNRIVAVGTLLVPGPGGSVRLEARTLSPDTCLSAGGMVCRRTVFGCSCHN